MNPIKTGNFHGAALSPLNQDKFEGNTIKNNVSYISFGSLGPQKEFSVGAMAPLLINTDNELEMRKFNNDLQFAKDNGVKSISVDVWWGVVQKEGEQKFDWKYYDKIFKTIKDKGLNLTPILSTHLCGGNVGDNVNIPIPKWTWDYLAENLGMDTKINDSDFSFTKMLKQKQKDGLYYTNEHGDRISEVVPVWYDDIIMPKYNAFAQEFKNHFVSTANSELNMKNIIDEIHVSCGPSGELRYPTYGENLKGAEFPTRGWLVGYGQGGKNSFQKYAEAKYNNIYRLNSAWGTNLESFKDIQAPHNNSATEGMATEFVNLKHYENHPYGKDFLEWYHNTLVKHGEDILTGAHEVFKDTDIPIAIKIPGIHWQMNNPTTPRIAEIVSGQIDSNLTKENDYGYKSFFDMVKSVKNRYNKNDTITYFTCLEMDNDLTGFSNGKSTNSAARTLVDWVLDAAKKRGLTIKGENAIEGSLLGENAWNNFKYHAWGGYDGATFLRVGTLRDNKYFKDFMNWLNRDLMQKLKNAA